MSLIIHMKVPGAIVAASDCRITGTEGLYIPVKAEKTNLKGQTVLDLGRPEELNPQKKNNDDVRQVPFGHYDFVKTDSEQKTFLLRNSANTPFAIGYCGNANLNGYPASYQIKLAMKRMADAKTTIDIAKSFSLFWHENNINQPPSLLIGGYNDGKASIIELKADGSEALEHFTDDDSFGLVYHGESEITRALLGTGEFQYSLFRLQDAIDFCKTMITTTAKIQSFQRKQQTVSEKYDILAITDEKAVWISRDTFEL